MVSSRPLEARSLLNRPAMRLARTYGVSLTMALACAVGCGGTVESSSHDDRDASTSDSAKSFEGGKRTEAGDMDVDYCALAPPACADSFDMTKPCTADSAPCQTAVCEACSENAYSLDATTFYCRDGAWTESSCGAGDCGSGSPGPGMPGTYADPMCKTVWLADGGTGPAADGGLDGG